MVAGDPTYSQDTILSLVRENKFPDEVQTFEQKESFLLAAQENWDPDSPIHEAYSMAQTLLREQYIGPHNPGLQEPV